MLASTCFTCHGPEGRAPSDVLGGIPSLQGRSADLLRQRMRAFRAGTAADATVMHRLMQGYDDAQIDALAQWFARRRAP